VDRLFDFRNEFAHPKQYEFDTQSSLETILSGEKVELMLSAEEIGLEDRSVTTISRW
jgi:hypothetical protein